MDLLLMKDTKTLIQTDRFMDTLTGQVSGCPFLIMLMTSNVVRYINAVEEEYCLARWEKQQLI